MFLSLLKCTREDANIASIAYHIEQDVVATKHLEIDIAHLQVGDETSVIQTCFILINVRMCLWHNY